MKTTMLTAFFALAATAAWAQDEKKDEKRERLGTVELEWRYDLNHPDVLDRENLTSMTLAPIQALHLGFEELLGCLPKDEVWPRTLAVPAAVGLRYLEDRWMIYGHEKGHELAWSRLGFTDGRLEWDPLDNHGSFRLHQADWDAFTARYAGRDRHVVLATVEASGLNQDEHTRARVAMRFVDGKAFLADGITLLNGLIAIQDYPEGGDLDDYVAEEALLGVDTSASRIRNLQWLRYLSGSTFTFGREALDFLLTGDLEVRPSPSFRLGDVSLHWPEFTTHLTAEHGLTAAVTIPLRWTSSDGSWSIRHDVMLERSVDVSAWEVGMRESITAWGSEVFYQGRYNLDTHGYWTEVGLALGWQFLRASGSYYRGSGVTFHRDQVGKVYELEHEREDGFLLALRAEFTF
jgi:hypothetical protein